MYKNLVVLLLLAFISWRCTETESNLEDEMTREYFPVKVGNYWIYEVTETTFIDQLETQPTDSTRYQIREVVDTFYTDQSGEKVFKLIRSRRADASKPWSNDSLVLVNKTFSSVRVTRNNKQTVNLVFPARPDKKWNGNAFNNLGEEEYTYQDLGLPLTVNGKNYDNTVKVIQYFEENLVVLEDRQEIYALGVGLIYKKVIDFDYCSKGPGQNCELGQGYVVKGRKRIQKLSAFGMEI